MRIALLTAFFFLQQWIALSQPSEQSLLYDFYASTSGWDSSCSGGWSTNTTPPCSGSNSSWAKVTCSGGAVTQINLYGCSIQGTLPPQWGNMTSVQTLELSYNALSGTLPPQWGSMTNVQSLGLHGNALSGTLPRQWGSLASMQSLGLYSNALSGTLPPQWSNMTSMQYLGLNSNSLSGTLPLQWGRMTNVQILELSYNALSGTLPPQLGSMTNMQTLGLNSNSLRGTLPSEWSNMTNVQRVWLNNNGLTGTLPPEWGNMTEIQSFKLSYNSLNGTLPLQWSGMTIAQTLELSYNALSGTLPLQWCSMTSMQSLELSSNYLSGTLPQQWGSMTNIQSLGFNSNSLTGTLPPEWGNMTYIQLLGLNRNSLTGALPSQWGSMTSMQTLGLSSNAFSGTLPPQWGRMRAMLSLGLSSNSLSGTLPADWSSMTSTQIFGLSNNALSGTLPPEWSNMTNMQWFVLNNNSVTGTLPPQWSNMTNMQSLGLSSNSLSGTLPPLWGSMKSLRSLGLSSNSLGGTLPPQWANMSFVRILSLQFNRLVGTLPSEWSSFGYAALTCNVSWNCLTTSTANLWWRDLSRVTSPQRFDCFRHMTLTPSSSLAMGTTAPSHSMLATSSHTHRVPQPLDRLALQGLPMDRPVVVATSGAAFVAGVVELALGPFASVSSAGGGGVVELAAVSQVSCRRGGGSDGKDSSSLSRLSLSFFFDLGPLWIVGGNVAVAVGFCVLHAAAVMTALFNARRCGDEQRSMAACSAALRFPGFSLTVCTYLCGGTAFGAVRLASEVAKGTYAGSAAVLAAVGLLLPLMFATVVQRQLLLRFVAATARPQVVMVAELPSGSWWKYALPLVRWKPPELTRRFGPLFSSLTPPNVEYGCIWLSCVGLVFTVVAAAPFSDGSDVAACGAQYLMLCLLSMLSFAAVALRRPYRAPLSNVLVCVAALCQAASLCGQALTYLIDGLSTSSSLSDFIAAMITVQCVANVLRSCYQIGVRVLEGRSKSKLKPTEKNDAANLCGGAPGTGTDNETIDERIPGSPAARRSLGRHRLSGQPPLSVNEHQALVWLHLLVHAICESLPHEN